MLAVLTLVTVLVVSLLLTTQYERNASNLARAQAQSDGLANFAADQAKERIQEAILTGSQFGNSSYTTWASEPGRIHVFTINLGDGSYTRSAYDLFSGLPGADNAKTPELNNVDLNKPNLSGMHPITGSRPGTMKVGWISVLKDPTLPPSATNPIVGRVAYWVDDESCKVNINTADGSQRTATPAQMAASKKYSYGFGTPSELSLAVLPGLDQTKAAAIAESAWLQEHNSLEELARAGSGGAVDKEGLEAIRFDVTHYNSSPDLNFMGEPRLSLIPAPVTASNNTPDTSRQNSLLGESRFTTAYYSYALGTAVPPARLGPLDFIYPQPSQIPKPPYLPLATDLLFLHSYNIGRGQSFSQIVSPATSTTNYDYYVGKVITSYLAGTNLRGKTFAWPQFSGATAKNFTEKYTRRQLDSITLQILDVAGKVSLCDQGTPWTYPTTMTNGWLSNEPALGVARTLLLNELYLQVTTTPVDSFGYGATIGDADYQYPSLSAVMTMEVMFPEGFGGVPINLPYDGAIQQAYNYSGGYDLPSTLNFYDAPIINSTSPQRVIRKSQTGTMWMDQMLTVLDQGNQPAGFDLTGNPRSSGDPINPANWVEDPDQSKAALYHPYTVRPDGRFTGSSLAVNKNDGAPTRPLLGFLNSNSANSERAPGVYAAINNRYAGVTYHGKPDSDTSQTTSLRLVGGINYWIRFGNNYGRVLPAFAPFDSMLIAVAQGAPPATPWPAVPDSPALLTPPELDQVLKMVVPIDLTVPVPGSRQLLVRCSDPLVNHFPADWELLVNPASSEVTLPIKTGAGAVSYYKKGGTASLDPFYPPDPTVTQRPTNFNGDNPGFRPSGGGDPLSIWLPTQDVRLPKQARFPSIGALFSVRTGIFPDPDVAALPYRQQHGVPFRVMNFAPSSQASQKTTGGGSYPDWAMLDLFTVPFLPQKPYMDGDPAQPYRRLTAGGATIGRININNPVTPYPFGEGGPNTVPPQRNSLQALFYGLRPSRGYTNEVADYTPIDASESALLAQAVSDYQKLNGPFFMGGQIANVPRIASYLYQGGKPGATSRNDLVRDTIGALTTRSNVYSIWVVAQTIQKKPGNVNYGTYEPGDSVLATSRRRYLVERYLETGMDNLPGNGPVPRVAGLPNAYGLANTTNLVAWWNGDAVSSTYHPAMNYPLPYRWRTVEAKMIAQ